VTPRFTVVVFGGLLFTAGFRVQAEAQSEHVLVIVGLAGEPEDGQAFHRWGATLAGAAIDRFGVPRDHVLYLADKPDESNLVTGRSTRNEIEKAFEALSKSVAADDPVYIVLIGHGSFDGRVAKFNLPGPDMSAGEFATMLKRVQSQHVLFVNTASASGPFVAELSGPGRTIVTATRNGSERFATLFGGYFVDALTGDEADADRSKRVSVLEAFDYSRREVARAYEREGLIATEHALLDDDGDGHGTAEPTETTRDGRLASALSLGTVASTESLPSDPKLRGLYLERRELEQRVEALKLLKASMEPARYLAELEKRVTELALKTREIRQMEGKQ
jgi:hypothetical protein